MLLQQLDGKTTKEKMNLKGGEIAKHDFRGVFEKIEKESTIKVDVQSINDIDGGVEVLASAWKNGERLGFGKDGSVEIERFRFFNPPVLVDSPNGDIIKEIVNPYSGEVRQRKLKFDPVEAIKQSLSHVVSLVCKEGTEITKGKVGNTTSTFYPAAGANSPVDGQVARQSATESYDSLRNGVGSDSADTGATEMAYLQNRTSDNNWQNLFRVITLFDTSSIGTDTVDSATWSGYGSDKAEVALAGQSATIVVPDPASNSALVDSDYNIANWTMTAQNTSDITITAFSTAGYNDFALNATGKGNINTSGITKFGMVLDSDRDNSEPTWSSASQYAFTQIHAADASGTSQDPKLVVEHTASASTFIPKITIS